MSRAIRVVAWSLVAVLLGWLCLASLLDRLAAQGVLVATPDALSFGGDMLAARATQAWRAGDLPVAARLAQAAVTRRPVDAAALRLAGSIALARGDAAGGDALMRLAGAAGWRDRPTQLYWGKVAVQQGAWAIAVERAEALARTDDLEDERVLIRLIEAAPAGRAALVQRWDGMAPWLLTALDDWPGSGPTALANHFATVLAVRSRLDRDARRSIASPLVQAGHIDWAFAIVQPDERRLGFTSGWTMPLDWTVAAAAGLDAAEGEGDSLHVRANGPALLPLAQRLVRLPTGTTRMDLTTAGAHTDLPLIVTLDCVKGQGATTTPVAARGDRSSFDLVVPPGCPFQWLKLAVAGEAARRGTDFLLYPPTLTRAAAVP